MNKKLALCVPLRTNISGTVNINELSEFARSQPDVKWRVITVHVLGPRPGPVAKRIKKERPRRRRRGLLLAPMHEPTFARLARKPT